MSNPAPNLITGLLSEDPKTRLLAVGHFVWQVEAQARTVALAQQEAANGLPVGELSDECKKNIAAVHGVATNLCGWLDDVCKSIYGHAGAAKTEEEKTAPIH